MTTRLKRSHRSSSCSVSPPPVKRKIITRSIVSSRSSGQGASSLRVFSWNVNGVNALLQKTLSFDTQADFPLRAFLRRHDWPPLLCLQEVKINAKDDKTQRRLRQVANSGTVSAEPSYTVKFSLPRDRYNATGFGGKFYGVATLIREDFVGHIRLTRLPSWDLEGRVLIHELVDGLVIINGYWVNGTANVYRDPETGDARGTRHDHKLRFHQHMLDETVALEKNGQHVILVGDMNVARSQIDGHPNLRTSPVQHVRNRFDFNQNFFDDPQGIGAVDVFRRMHGDKAKYTYHPRGCGWGESCDRVDLIIATRGLFDRGAILSTDICDNPGDRGHSDHVPLWVEVDMRKIL